MRLVLHRAFLSLAIRRHKQDKPIDSTLLMLATNCVDVAVEIIELTTSSVNAGSSGCLQAFLLQATGYLWNSTITLMLCIRCHSLQERIPVLASGSSAALTSINSSIAFFQRHADAIPFARTARERASELMKKENDPHPKDALGQGPSNSDIGLGAPMWSADAEDIQPDLAFDVSGYNFWEDDMSVTLPNETRGADFFSEEWIFGESELLRWDEGCLD